VTEEQESFAALLPPDFTVRMRRALGRELEPFLAALADPPSGLRVNTLRLEPGRFAALSPFPLRPLPFPPAGFVLGDGERRPGRHPYHAAGLYYLQDPGAMAVAALVAPRPGERVLDLAAAPGGKATHLAALMEGQGVLVANDIHPGRARELAGNLERCGVRNAVVTSERAARLAERWPGFFDRVLLDAPCSGESMFHKSAAARDDWSEAAVQGCARRQSELLASAARLVRPRGLLVYSTCTFSEEENEQVAGGFLREHADFETAPLPAVPGSDPVDLQGDASGGSRPTTPADAAPSGSRGATALRLWPHRVLGAGHFVAAFRRADTAASHAPPSTHEYRPSPPPDATLRHFEEMRAGTLGPGIAVPQRPALFGSELVDVPADAPSLERLRVVRAGWWIGTALRNRVEPSHPLALGIPPDGALRSLDVEPDDPRLAAYLSGLTIDSAGPPGWVLVRVSGFAIGWGKRVGSVVKNHYPKGLRQARGRG
jgi:16S rRNA C967 or C1407 C5-methylase (RsmB/RsmF family)/NOL1/NOP2/fmu family ribosome biogenesis protein